MRSLSKILLAVLLSLVMCSALAVASGIPPMKCQEADGTPSFTCYKLKFQNGALSQSGATATIDYTYTKCAAQEDLAATDDDSFLGMFNTGVTITGVGVHCKGTCTTPAQISLEDRAGNAMTHTTPTASTGTDNTTFQSVTAANTLVAGEGLRYDVDNTPSPDGEDEYLICYTYTVSG